MGIDCCMNNCVNFFSDISIRGAGCGVGCWHRRFGCFGGVSGVGLAGLAPLWGLVLGMLITFRCNTIFFFVCVCVGPKGGPPPPPPQRQKCRGDIFQEKNVHFSKI